MRGRGELLVVSCYELGRPPLGAALPFSWLKRAGFSPSVFDLAVSAPSDGDIQAARLIVVSTPMHTAMRLGIAFAERARRLNPGVKLLFHGLYAWLNRERLLGSPALADFIVGGEAEESIVKIAQGEEVDGVEWAAPILKRLKHPPLDRGGLPGISSYAKLRKDGKEFLAGVVETTRGCKHVCRHCPITPVYGGRFFAFDEDAVISDARFWAESGAEHITFSDPDFLNGPTRAVRLCERLHREFPLLSFDFTAKVEHLLAYKELLPRFAKAGVIFIVSAAESLSEQVLLHLDKGHRPEDVHEALVLCRNLGIALRPTWVPFTPWDGLEGYLGFLDFIQKEGLVYSTETVQLGIRLLLPPGSPLIELPQMKPHLRGASPDGLSYSWEHSDAAVDRLQKEVMALASAAAASGEDEAETFAKIRAAARAALDGSSEIEPVLTPGSRAPGMSEPWFCCAEPTEGQIAGV